VLKPNKIQRI